MIKCFSHLLLVLGLLGCLAAADDGFTTGRATYYTDNTQGSCHYGTDIPEWYAAWPDGQAGAPNCGSCFEVACVDADFTDGYGDPVHRKGACYDTSKTVRVKIVDSCPCVHQNFYSNQRWCCQDMQHMDLADKVFAELADPSLGVIGAKWRQVSCDNLGPSSSADSNDGSSKDGSSSADSNDNTSPSPSQAPSHTASSGKPSYSWPSWSSRSSWARNWHWGAPDQWSDGATGSNNDNNGSNNSDKGSSGSNDSGSSEKNGSSGSSDSGSSGNNASSNNSNGNNDTKSSSGGSNGGSSDSNRYKSFGDILAKAWMGGS